MRSATDIVEEIMSIVDSPELDSDKVLHAMNMAQNVISNRTFLPGLSNGKATVQTVIGDRKVPMPSDYHKTLSIALVGDRKVSVDIFSDLKSLDAKIQTGEVIPGDVFAVAVHQGNLYYYKTPELPTDIELFYYRKPVKMSDSSSSFPDGFTENDDFEYAIIHFSCWKLFEKIEQGLEGNKPDTMYHKGLFEEFFDAVDLASYRVGKMFPEPSINKTW